MAALPPESTPRYRINYTSVSKQHSMQIRSAASPSALGVIVDDLFTALSPLLFATVIDSVEFAADNSNIFNPVTSGIEANTYGSGAGNPQNVAWFYSFIGRTAGGRRVRIYVYGVSTLGFDYRVGAGESVDVDAARAVLVAAGTNIKGIDDLVPVWKTYANAGANAYWQKAIRP